MKKHITFIFIASMFLLLAACSSANQAPDRSLLSPESLGLQPTNTNYTRDFDPATNQTITFGDIAFQIPKDWSVAEQEDAAIYIEGKEPSQLGWMCIELLAENVHENHLAGNLLQSEIVDSFSQTFSASGEFAVTNRSYNHEDQLFFINYERSLSDISAYLGICAFVESENLYAYIIPFADGDTYKYSLDVQEIVRSVSPFVPQTSTDEINTAPTTPVDTPDSTFEDDAQRVTSAEVNLPQISHNWDNGTITKPATCSSAGAITYTCTDYSEQRTENTPPLDHSYTEQVASEKYLAEKASYTSGSLYYTSCTCGAPGISTFKTDDRIKWISVADLEDDDNTFNCSFNPVNGDAAETPYYWMKNYNTNTAYEIYGVPKAAPENGKIYTFTCNEHEIRFKAEKSEDASHYQNYFFFYYDDLVAAGII